MASKDSKNQTNTLRQNNIRLLKSAAIFGANASGKSNVVKAFALVSHFVANSASRMNLGDEIRGITPFRLLSNAKNQPSRFVVVFMCGKRTYRYTLAATMEQVWEESLSLINPRTDSEDVWYKREYHPEKDETSYTIGSSLAKEGLNLSRTLPNMAALSKGAQEGSQSLREPYLWFRSKVLTFDLSSNPEILQIQTINKCQKDGNFFNKVKELLRSVDFGIENIVVQSKSTSIDRHTFVPDMPKVLKEIQDVIVKHDDLESLNINEQAVVTSHMRQDDGGLEEFNFTDDESNGTQRFFSIIGPVIYAIEQGSVIMVDEIDSSMHPLLIRKLIEYFQNPAVNTKGAQLIFTTHDSSLMDSTLFRRDQVYIVEKNRGESEIYSLYDFKNENRPRSHEAFGKNYMVGKYGGLPQFGPLLEDIDTHIEKVSHGEKTD